MVTKKKVGVFVITLVTIMMSIFLLSALVGKPSSLPIVNKGTAVNDTPSYHEDEIPMDMGENFLRLSAMQIESAGIVIVPVGRGGGQELRMTGRVESPIEAKVAVAATVSGRVETVKVTAGEAVKAGQPLAVLFSGDAADLQAQVDKALAEAEVSRLAYQRYQTLFRRGVVARQELDIARTSSLSAEAALRAAQAQAKAAGSPDTRGRIVITSPMNGRIGMVRVTPGGFVSSTDVVAEVFDPTMSEFVFTTLPEFTSQITEGTNIVVTATTGIWEASVVGIALNAIENSAYALVRARSGLDTLPPIGTPVSGVAVTNIQKAGFTVPIDALQTLDEQSVVFAVTEGGFRAIPVLAGHQVGGNVEILKGLTGAEHLAGSNAFLLKAELAKGKAEHGH